MPTQILQIGNCGVKSASLELQVKKSENGVSQSDEKKPKKSSKKKSDAKKSEARSPSDAKKETAESSGAEMSKGAEATAKKEPAKKEEGFGLVAIIIAVIVSFGAGAGALFFILRRRLAAALPPAPPKQIPSVLETAVVVVESKSLHTESAQVTVAAQTGEEPAKEKTASKTIPKSFDSAKPVAPVAPTYTDERAELPTSPQSAPKADAEKRSAPRTADKERELIAAENATPAISDVEKPTIEKTTLQEPTELGLLLDDNAIDLSDSRSKDLFILNTLAQESQTKKDDEPVSDQLLLPEETELLLDGSVQQKQETSLLAAYQMLATPEAEQAFMSQVTVCTMSKFQRGVQQPYMLPGISGK
ncbi:MAG: hypothetical protein RML35_02125 [Chloroherpetonaceae bacterium]|nr:hypothetical protein [Chloroherpetonaceae bacterium]